MRRFFEEYGKHFALNIGQTLQGVRHFFSHPDIDTVAPRGSAKHAVISAQLRSKRIANDLFFAVIPPHWHHTPEELKGMCNVEITRWFQYGYCAWRFDETGAPKKDLSNVDERWDPRCREPAP